MTSRLFSQLLRQRTIILNSRRFIPPQTNTVTWTQLWTIKNALRKVFNLAPSSKATEVVASTQRLQVDNSLLMEVPLPRAKVVINLRSRLQEQLEATKITTLVGNKPTCQPYLKAIIRLGARLRIRLSGWKKKMKIWLIIHSSSWILRPIIINSKREIAVHLAVREQSGQKRQSSRTSSTFLTMQLQAVAPSMEVLLV